MRFIEAYEGWHAGELTQTQAAQLLGMCDRSFRRYLARYEEFDLAGLIDKRIEQISHRRAPVDEVMKFVALYSTQYEGWNIKHFIVGIGASTTVCAATGGSRCIDATPG